MTDVVFAWLPGVFLVLGCLFFAVGTLGLFRFTDTLTRTHALTKVDNLGLGFVALAVLLMAPSWVAGAKTLLVWALAMAASATSAHLVARAVKARRAGEPLASDSAGRRGAQGDD